MRKMVTKRWWAVAAVVLLMASGGAVVAASGDEPPQPPWVREDGTVDMEAFPEALEVAGPDGKSVVCANGERLKVPRSMLVGPPPVTPEALRRQGQPHPAGYTYRCGRGSNPHLNPVRVPAA